MASKNTDHKETKIQKLVKRLDENDGLLECLESIVETAAFRPIGELRSDRREAHWVFTRIGK